MQIHEFDIDPAHQKKRLDVFLAEREEVGLTRSFALKLIKEGRVTVNGHPVKAHYRLKAGDHVTLTVPDVKPLEVSAEPIPLKVVYEDACMIVIDKPAGMVVHPAPGHFSGTLVNALLHHCKDLAGIGGVERPGIVHRLDKDTSGLIVAAKTESAMRSLAAQFKNRTVRKVYLALVRGTLPQKEGWIETPIGRHPAHRKKMSARTPRAREAQTRYEVIRQFETYALVRLIPKTGRTHQLRVHLASLGHPILGDTVYGGTRRKGVPVPARQALHAHRLELDHPVSGQRLEFESPLPEDLARWITVPPPGDSQTP